MRSISILEQLLAIVRPDSSKAPSIQVAEHGDGLLLTLAPPDISDEERAEVWQVFSTTLVEELRREAPEMRVRVVPPGDGLSGVLQYSWPRRTTSIVEERLYWEAIVAALPTVEALVNARLSEARESPSHTYRGTPATHRTSRRATRPSRRSL